MNRFSIKTIIIFLTGILLILPDIVFSTVEPDRSEFTSKNTISGIYSQLLIFNQNSGTTNLNPHEYNFVDGLVGLGGITGIEPLQKTGGEITYKRLNNDREACLTRVIEENKRLEQSSFSPHQQINNCFIIKYLYLINRILII